MRITTGNHVTATVPEGVVVNSGNVNANITNASINANVTGDINVASGNINVTSDAQRLLGKTNLTEEISLANQQTITSSITYTINIQNAKTVTLILRVHSLATGTSLQLLVWERISIGDMRNLKDVPPYITETGFWGRTYNAYTKKLEITVIPQGTSPSATISLVAALRG